MRYWYLLGFCSVAMTACGDDGSGAFAGSGGTQSGGAGNGGRGGSGGLEPVGGVAEVGSPPVCENGLAILDRELAATHLSYANEKNLAIGMSSEEIRLFQIPSSWSSVVAPKTEVLTQESLGIPVDDPFTDLAVLGDQVILSARSIYSVSLADDHTVNDLGCPLDECNQVVAGQDLLATSDGSVVWFAERLNGEWSWQTSFEIPELEESSSGDRGRVVAVAGSHVFVAQPEYLLADESGNEERMPAKLLTVSSQGEIVSEHTTVGNAGRPRWIDGGWLFPETNSFWGSMQAALEWYEEQLDSFTTLTSVPVRSAGDGTDGAYAVDELEGQVYVANCESGLLSGTWSRAALDLTPIGNLQVSPGVCSVKDLVRIKDVLMIQTDQELLFARPCSAD